LYTKNNQITIGNLAFYNFLFSAAMGFWYPPCLTALSISPAIGQKTKLKNIEKNKKEKRGKNK